MKRLALIALAGLALSGGTAQAANYLHEAEARDAAHAWVRSVGIRHYHDEHPSIDGCRHRTPTRVDCLYRFSLKLFEGQTGTTRLSDILHVHKRHGHVWVIDPRVFYG